MSESTLLPDQTPGVTGFERLMAGLAHGGPFFSLPVVLPLLVWFVYYLARGSLYVRHQAMQALLFHLLAMLVLSPLWAAVVALWGIVLIGWPFALVLSGVAGCLSLWAIWVVLVATVRGFQGRPHRMPLVGGFVRPE